LIPLACLNIYFLFKDKTIIGTSFKDVFGQFSFLIDLFYIYIYYRTVNAEFNKLIKQ